MVDEQAGPADFRTGLDLAIRLARAGYWLAPVRLHWDPRLRRKSPDYLRIKWHDQASDDPDQVRDWYAQHGPDVSFLVDCGRSGVFGVDLDVTAEVTGRGLWERNGFPDSPLAVDTPGGGRHHYFRQPAGRTLTVAKRVHGMPIDVRAVGGHLYAPGAVVLNPDGTVHGRYGLVGDLVPAAELPELPAEVAAFLHAKPDGGPPRAPSAQGELRHRSVVVDICREQLGVVAGSERRTESGFRSKVLGAAMVLGRGVAAGMWTRGAVEARLARAVAQVWGAANEDDLQWIRDGMDDGERDPWTVVDDDYDTEINRKSITHKIVSSSSATARSSAGSQAQDPFEIVSARTAADSGGQPVDVDQAQGADQGRTRWDAVALTELDDIDTWEPASADLVNAILDGTVSAPEPAVGLVRTDGHPFLYPGLEHAVIGEMEAGKSWFALACVAAELKAGNRCIYLHFEESDPTATYLRLHRQFTVERAALLERFVFIGPERRVTVTDVERALAGGAPSLVVLDGVNEAMALHGMAIYDVDGTAEYRRKLVKPWKRAGAAVLSLDHVPKDPETRSSGYAFGSVGKGNAVDGAVILLENLEAFGDGRSGATAVYVTKDRNGQLRKLGRPAEGRSSGPRKYYVGRVLIDATNALAWRFEFVPPAPEDSGPDPEFELMRQERRETGRLAELDEKVLAAVVDLDGKGIEVSSNRVRVQVGARRADVSDALYRLEAGGLVKNTSYGQAARWVPVAPQPRPES